MRVRVGGVNVRMGLDQRMERCGVALQGEREKLWARLQDSQAEVAAATDPRIQAHTQTPRGRESAGGSESVGWRGREGGRRTHTQRRSHSNPVDSLLSTGLVAALHVHALDGDWPTLAQPKSVVCAGRTVGGPRQSRPVERVGGSH